MWFEGSTSTKGLGLHTMREHTEAIGATFGIKSEQGQGTTLTVEWKQPAQAESSAAPSPGA